MAIGYIRCSSEVSPISSEIATMINNVMGRVVIVLLWETPTQDEQKKEKDVLHLAALVTLCDCW